MWFQHLTGSRQRAAFSWLFISALLVLCGVLGVLQYRWIGDVTFAVRERLRGGLDTSLNRCSEDFNSEIGAAARGLMPGTTALDAQAVESAVAARFDQWRKSNRRRVLFSRVALAEPTDGALVLRSLDLQTGIFQTVVWPPDWSGLNERLMSFLTSHDQPGRMPPGMSAGGDRLEFEVPLFPAPLAGSDPRDHHGRGRRFPGREIAWIVFELNLPYVQETMLPELVQHELPDYQVEVVIRDEPSVVIYKSDADEAVPVSSNPDASTNLFEPPYDGRPMGPPRGGEHGRQGPLRPSQMPGRWQMNVRHRAGSLEAVVSQARWRNLLVTGGVFVLMLATVAALVRFTRRAQWLAAQQMDFVAGVSHELRTPLTVLHTAGYNLQGKVAHNPAQVERYGVLIQHESGRLRELVEQVLRFAGTEAGRVIQEPEQLSVEQIIEDTMESSKAVVDTARLVIERGIEPDLPPILGDAMALKHALQNLLSNAAKYGTKDSNWIGIFAARASDDGRPMVEIRVADHGPGIPPDEQKHIFDPFYRGQQASQEQVHGTGLGLNLVKKIVEAHGGTIQVRSEPMKGAEFIMRIPQAVPGVAG